MSDRLVPVLLLVLLFLLMIGAMVLGWRRRGGSHQDLPPLESPREDTAPGTDEDALRADCVYVSTTLAEQPLERVVAHGLGARSRAVLAATEDAGRPVLRVDRQGASSFVIPVGDVLSVHTAPGMAGKWVGGDGLLVLRWRLGRTVLDTGFRLDRAEDQTRFLALDPGSDAPPRPGAAPTTTPPDSTAPEARKEHP